MRGAASTGVLHLRHVFALIQVLPQDLVASVSNERIARLIPLARHPTAFLLPETIDDRLHDLSVASAGIGARALCGAGGRARAPSARLAPPPARQPQA